MRIYSIVSTLVSGVLMAGVSTVAFAGSCANGANCGSNYNAALAPYEGVSSAVCRARLEAGNRVSTCSTRSVVHNAAADPLATINYTYSNPYGHLKTFAYKNTPDVNIMRIHARPPMAALSDVPTQFSNGCNPVTPSSCGRKIEVIISKPAPVYKPVMRPAPVPVMRPAPHSFVRPPVIQHMPFASVAPVAPVAPVQFQSHNFGMPNNIMGGKVIGHVSGGSYTYQKSGSADYWEKASGATVVGGLPVSQIICRRAGSAATSQRVNVVRPVIGVPTAVPVMRPNCIQAPRPVTPIVMGMAGNGMAGNRWTH